MKKLLKPITILSIFMLLTSCLSDDSQDPIYLGTTKTYDFETLNESGVTGTARFIALEDGSTIIELDLDGTTEGNTHPAHIHYNTAAETGDIAIQLQPVTGSTGMSTTTVTSVSFQELIAMDGYINVHLSADDLGTIVAQVDIGQNELTGESMVYQLEERDVEGISGTATFYERANGEALAILELANTPTDGMHPAHIHMGNAATGGSILFTFNAVDGNTGESRTNVAAFDDESAFMYEDIMDLDGYINVHLSADMLGTIVAQGDIGQNALTGTNMSYDLNEMDVPGISGTVTFYERMSGNALAVISLQNTPAGGMHPAHIHMNDAATGGDIIFSFNPVNGDTGISRTDVSTYDDSTPFSYADVLTVDGYVNVHLSAEDLATLVAQGNIGANM